MREWFGGVAEDYRIWKMKRRIRATTGRAIESRKVLEEGKGEFRKSEIIVKSRRKSMRVQEKLSNLREYKRRVRTSTGRMTQYGNVPEVSMLVQVEL